MSIVNLQSPSGVTTKPLHLGAGWYLRHSTRAVWRDKRNVHTEESHNQHSSPSETLSFSYQEPSSSEIKTREEVGWKVLGNGKDGKLESWMKETDWGIEDSSGEIRADWRARWMVIYFPPTSAPPSPAGLDILSSRQQELADDTVEAIRASLDLLDGLAEEPGKIEILQVANDGARDREMQDKRKAEHEKWEKRTGPAEGISPDLIYDDEEPKDSGKCIVM